MTERLTVVLGCMFAGKTDELVRLIERQEYAGRKSQIFKPELDNRWGKTAKIHAHTGRERDAIPVKEPGEILSLVGQDIEVVGIDEIQFFGPEIISVVEELLNKDKKVLVAGLPQNFRGEPFGQMPILLTKADELVLLTAICTHGEDGRICGAEATRTQRLVNGRPASYDDPEVLIGAEEAYAPRCPQHHKVLRKPQKR